MAMVDSDCWRGPGRLEPLLQEGERVLFLLRASGGAGRTMPCPDCLGMKWHLKEAWGEWGPFSLPGVLIARIIVNDQIVGKGKVALGCLGPRA